MAIDDEKTVQFLVVLKESQLEKVKDYWHKKRLNSRNEAIRELLDKALKEAEDSK